jgi:ATP-binding cassette subfamily C (CFTR/MRP) protein 1
MANSSLDVICNAAADGKFGPGIQCSQFDFTLSFEQTIFFLGVSASFLIFFPWRTYQLYGTTIKTIKSAFHPLKVVSRRKRPPSTN